MRPSTIVTAALAVLFFSTSPTWAYEKKSAFKHNKHEWVQRIVVRNSDGTMGKVCEKLIKDEIIRSTLRELEACLYNLETINSRSRNLLVDGHEWLVPIDSIEPVFPIEKDQEAKAVDAASTDLATPREEPEWSRKRAKADEMRIESLEALAAALREELNATRLGMSHIDETSGWDLGDVLWGVFKIALTLAGIGLLVLGLYWCWMRLTHMAAEQKQKIVNIQHNQEQLRCGQTGASKNSEDLEFERIPKTLDAARLGSKVVLTRDYKLPIDGGIHPGEVYSATRFGVFPNPDGGMEVCLFFETLGERGTTHYFNEGANEKGWPNFAEVAIFIRKVLASQEGEPGKILRLPQAAAGGSGD